ncbi:MAG: sugar ABC transporter substrate-binding protein [Selenomonadaceae bacterium]|nr:sugar ABC transporter substrate-binding protein [Selenomonadaceae bacterium]
MKKIKRLLALLCVGAMLAVSAGCGSGGNGSKTIAFVSHDDLLRFPGALYENVKEEAEKQGYQVEVTNAKMDANAQIDQMNEVIAKKPAAIILLPVDANAMLPAVKKANEEKIPILVTNRDIADGAQVAQVHSDERQAGRLQGEYMAKHLKQGAKIVYLFGDVTQVSARERWEGFKEACLDKRPDIQLLASGDGAWNSSNGMKYMTLWLRAFPEIDAVVSGNDAMALGAISAMKAAGRQNGVLVTGIDADSDALKAIAAGEMSQTIKQDPTATASKIFELVQSMISGGQSNDNEKVDFIEITKDNIGQFVK